ncbi:hypothetical protein QQ045_009124 [Rhodiola kirilowii]
MWAQRSRVTWLGEGDKNTRFFHLKANARKKINSISSLVDSQGLIHTEQPDLEQVAVSYYQQLFLPSVSMSDQEMLDSLHHIPVAISYAHNRMLTEPYSELEIRRALFQLYPYKAPGLDGYQDGFFQKFWGTIKRDFTASCLSILHEGHIPEVNFEPERGLWQSDPLSPYLFILCSEWLSHSLAKLERENKIKGIKVCRRASAVSHLMFADDCLLLFKAKDDTAEVLSSLLTKYEHISGQIINYSKSEIVLSPNAPASLRNIFRDHLSVTMPSHHAKYLGLPLTLQRKLTLNFSGIIDKFWNKTESWNSKNLSSGGKEILIKSVLQALPQYAMNYFLLPEHIINKMHSSYRKSGGPTLLPRNLFTGSNLRTYVKTGIWVD